MNREIIVVENTLLRTSCNDVNLDETTRALIQDLKDTLASRSTGVGLASPQIGELSKIFIVKFNDITGFFSEVFINPKLIRVSGVKEKDKEGCLSIPGTQVTVERYNKCRMEYYNEKFELINKKFTGFASRVIQHEYDHLLGKLITDYMKPKWAGWREGKLSRDLESVGGTKFKAGTTVRYRRYKVYDEKSVWTGKYEWNYLNQDNNGLIRTSDLFIEK